MVESDKQKTVVSGTQAMQKREIAEREKREVRISDTKSSEVVTKQGNQQRLAMRRFTAEESSVVVYQTPFELSSLNGTNGFQINGIARNDYAGYSPIFPNF